MKILHGITSLDKDGAQQMLLRLIQGLDSNNFNHVIISLRERMPLADDFERLGVKVYCLGMAPARPSLQALVRLRRIISDESPDIIHSWLYHANCAVVCAMAGMAKKIPIIWGIRGSLDSGWLRGFSTALVIRLSALLSRFADVITFNSRISIVQHKEAGYVCKDCRYIPNGFQLERFQPQESCAAIIKGKYNIPDDYTLVGIAGRYNQAKDYPGFLRAMRLVVDSRPNVAALLMGRGVDQNNLEMADLMDQLKLGSNVYLLGAQDDLGKILPALDVFCSSSVTEGFPNVVAEALACGVPCVVTDVGMSAELVRGAGIVVPARDVKALADGILSLVALSSDERKKLGTNGRQKICQEYDLSSVVRHYHDLYHEVGNQ